MAAPNETQIGNKVDEDRGANGDGGPPANTKTPAQWLAELQDEIAKQNTQLAELTEDNKLKKSDEAILKKLVADLDRIVEDYGKSTATYRSKLDHFKTYADNKGQMIAAAIKDKVQEIHAARSSCQVEINTLKGELAKAEQDLNAAKIAHDTAKAAFDQKTRIFEDFKILKKAVDGNLAGIQDLKTEIEAQECENKFGVMYFLFQELHQLRASTEIKVMDKDTFRNNLNNYWAAMNEAQADFRKKEEDWLDAKAAYDRKKKALQDAEAGFRDKVIAKLAEIQF